MKKLLFTLAILVVSGTVWSQSTMLQHVNLIDGTGKPLQADRDIIIRNGVISAITAAGQASPKDAVAIDMRGKYLMPQLINMHGHLGILKDTTMSASNYTPANIKHQLLRYQQYGVGTVVSMGTEQPSIIALRDSSRAGHIPGATIYSAIYGFGVKNAVPPVSMGMTKVYRPESAEQAIREVDSVAALKPDVIKIWVDDFWGVYPKMKPEIYAAIIKEAHIKGIRVAAHLYHLEDAHKLVALGLDMMAHSIRDGEIDDELIAAMKKKNVAYIPTLSLDEFAYSYQRTPEWLNDPFFRASIEPGVFDMVTSPAYQAKIAKDPKTPQEIAALPVAMRNLYKLWQAGILVCIGTDSGALPIRPQGFSEHMEMQLFVQAGLTPLQAITAATLNGAKLLKIEKTTGSIQPGKKADFIILDEDPTVNIRNTRSIRAVWKDGVKVSDGPLAGTAYAAANNGKIVVLAQIRISPGHEAEVKQAAQAIWAATVKEPGCESFIFNLRKDDPSVIMFYEVFHNQQGYDNHRAQEHTKTFLGNLKGKVIGDGPSVTFLTQLNK
jgi:imidazolonepropionase-like amidohydrolase/quinol monooxygenase YgiN